MEMKYLIKGHGELRRILPSGLTVFGIEVYNQSDANVEIVTEPKSKHLIIYVKKANTIAKE
jgi:hypothetical protein